ncbi:APC family permease [Methanogenium organophilum]|uniref:APC family permease n=1 Tax=Methanogenium organophilum TaxID=2199 RepID=A0A9X9S2Y7_METOG|nr:APC family permease [Methanogenium organophilum]WAI00561.1 APC family permease [Methanogenium organophilum]
MAPDTNPSLRRTLTFPEVVISGVGVILGAGIYALIGEAAAVAGNAIWISFVLAALIASFTGLSYMELSSMFPGASAEYEYSRHPFGNLVAFIIGIMVILSGIVGAATVSLGFAGYFSGWTGAPALPVAVVLLVALCIILLSGIRQSAVFAIIFTLIEAGGLIGIIIIGLPYLGTVDYFAAPDGFPGIFAAAALIFFAYQGFEEIVKLSDETVRPEKTIPAALLVAIAITIILYIAVSLSVVSIGGYEAIAGSPNPFAEIAGQAFSGGYTLFTVIALFATANTALLMMLASSRILYGMAKTKTLPEVIAYVHPGRRTPMVAIVGAAIVSMFFLLPGNIRDVALIANFTLFITFIVINAAVITLRRTMPDVPRPYRVPGTVGRVPVPAVLGIVTCLFFLFQLDWQILLIGIVLLGGAAFFGWILERRKMAEDDKA